ncbi:putative protein of unknown function (DUF4243) [Lyophyllum shimeji]|uniref:Oxidoreductase AflY n=1 Tax=Lyophyllum shimeji TaxID=47721 RepID=A0A9P3PX09_LYOSH|nr:putative protein of unknown function (DUF4243) [Lyophyllum shimeji]
MIIADMAAADTLDDLFPAPSAPASRLSPRIFPGITHQATETLRNILKDSYTKWHVFFLRDYRPHNHSVHCALASWAMGADEEIIKAAYALDCKMQLPKLKSPEPITAANFDEHLGDDEYYSAYLDFFTEVVRSKGVAAALEEYIFDAKANFVAGRDADKQPEMLNRSMDGIIHSLIHVGHGLEFGLPGLVAEGLAWTAVHFASSTTVIPPSLWETIGPAAAAESLASRFLGLGKQASKAPAQGNTHAFTVLARILKDSRFDDIPEAEHYAVVYSNVESKHGEAIAEHVRAWSFDHMSPGEVERKTEELVWACVMIYAISGWSKTEPFNADFFNVHLVTSSLFLSSIAAVLKPSSQELLLRSYFAVCLTWWIGRGRPELDIPAFFAETSAYPTPIHATPAPHKDALPSAESPKAAMPNPWFPLIEEALVIPDDHFPKTMRALAHYGEIYGCRVPGQPDFAERRY